MGRTSRAKLHDVHISSRVRRRKYSYSSRAFRLRLHVLAGFNRHRNACGSTSLSSTLTTAHYKLEWFGNRIVELAVSAFLASNWPYLHSEVVIVKLSLVFAGALIIVSWISTGNQSVGAQGLLNKLEGALENGSDRMRFAQWANQHPDWVTSHHD